MKLMKRYIYLVLSSAVALFGSCTVEEAVTAPVGEGEPVTVLLSASTGDDPVAVRGATTGTGDERDGEFTSLRVMVFRAGSILAYNKSVELTVEGNPFTIEMATGTYDFVFIANEDSDPALSARLADYKGKSVGSIFGESFSSTAFGNGTTIPMTGIVRNVVVTANEAGVGSISVGGAPQANPWKVEVERAAVRVDLSLRTKELFTAENFSALRISRVPKKVYLFDKNGSGNTIYNVTGSDPFEPSYRAIAGNDGDRYEVVDSKELFTEGDEQFTASPDADGYYWWHKRVILPSSLFADASDADNAILLTTVVGDRSLSAALGSGELGYTAPRNQRYKLVGTVEAGRPIEYTVSVTPWGANTNVELPVKIEGGGTPLWQRTYVGAFWRHDQTGERLIRIQVSNPGSWAVQVYEYGMGFSRNDILFSTSPSADPGIGWLESPSGQPADMIANDGAYQVTDGDVRAAGTTVEVDGNYYIFFRIGLNSTWMPKPTRPVRYATAVISYTVGNTTIYQKLFLRQGEDADYLMRPQDGSNNSTISSRPLAMPYSPYNLTHPDLKSGTAVGGQPMTGHPKVPARSTLTEADAPRYFTDYPSQAGAHFQWANAVQPRRAYHPTDPTSFISGWQLNQPDTYWSELAVDHETCPPGWRRPNDGSVSEDVAVSTHNIIDSEMRQSLWLNPQDGKDNSNIQNSVWGYYADGYFDRRSIVDGPGGTNSGNADASAVNTSNANVAYTGRLFFNPTTHASLFFPFSGYRLNSSGILNYTGARGYYWSSSSITSPSQTPPYLLDSGWLLFVSQRDGVYPNYNTRSFGFSIRCVRDATWTPGSGTLTATGPDYMKTDGGKYTVSVTSDTEWVATVRRTSDAVVSGPANLRGQPLLNPTTGFNTSPDNAAYGPSTSQIAGSGNATLTLTAADYTLPYGVVSGTLEIGFLSRTTGELLATVEIPAGLPEITDEGNAKDVTTYVGAFWKADQRGERLISMTVPTSTNYRGNWSVQVLDYGGFSEGDILFGAWDGVLPSDDYPSDTPSFSGGATSLTGTIVSGKFNFRIRLKQTIGPDDHRYARVLVSFGKDYIYNRVLFLRQGHEPDYVMHPNDVDVDRRGQVRRFSPYNLTASLKPGEGLTTDLDYAVVPATGGTFTAYPTQAGAMFLWCAQPGSKRRAWHPVKPYTPGEWEGSDAYEMTPELSAEDETCPPTYRRPTTEHNNSSPATTSEIGLSLVTALGVDNAANSAWGYYADGFFDRRTAGAASVESDNYKVAYDGRLFYNNSPNNRNASLFFPAAGYRNAGTGDLHHFTSYWTGTSYKGSTPSSGVFFYIEYNASNPVRFDIGSIRSTGGVIRCVKIE